MTSSVSDGASASEGVITALRNLQAKISYLEREREKAVSQLKHSVNTNERVPIPDAPDVLSKELETDLEMTRSRCAVLNQQIDNMRELLHNAEDDWKVSMKRSPEVAEKRAEIEQGAKKLEKISRLEENYLRLSALQNIAQEKLTNLEDKLDEEQKRRMKLEASAERRKVHELEEKLQEEHQKRLEAEAESKRRQEQMQPIITELVPPIEKLPKNEKGLTMSDSHVPKRFMDSKPKHDLPRARSHSPNDWVGHFRFHFNDLPFVAGKSVTPSHSLGSNIQELLATLKTHSRLCSTSPEGRKSSNQFGKSGASSGSQPIDVNMRTPVSSSRPDTATYNQRRNAADSHHRPKTADSGRRPSKDKFINKYSSNGTRSGKQQEQVINDFDSAVDTLMTVRNALQKDLGHMSKEQDRLIRLIRAEPETTQMRRNLEKRLELLLRRMESTGMEIAELVQHQNAMSEMFAGRSTTAGDSISPRGSRPTSQPADKTYAVKNLKATTRARPAQKLLHDLRSTKRTITKDDFNWE